MPITYASEQLSIDDMLTIQDIPFAIQAGLQQRDDGLLELPFAQATHNHIQTIHASAQFTLAETASGMFLLHTFPELAPRVFPVLRSSETKFRKPARSKLTAYPEIKEIDIADFEEDLHRKGRGMIPVHVEVCDEAGVTTLTGKFFWFVQLQAN